MSTCSLFFVYMKLPKKGITGIYKITNPKGRIYIGQARCIRKRWLVYINNNASFKNQPILYNSIQHHKPENHTFEIIHECEIEQLNELERYYQEVYNVTDRKIGLNCVLQETDEQPRVLSEETRRKMSEARKGFKYTEEQKKKMGDNRRGRKHTEEAKRKISEAHKGKKIPKEQIERLRRLNTGRPSPNKGKKMSEEAKYKMSESKKGKYTGLDNHLSVKIISKNHETKEVLEMGVYETARFFEVDWELINNRCKYSFVNPTKLKEWDFFYANKLNEFKPLNFGQSAIILDLESGVYYYSLKELSEFLNIKHATLSARLNRGNSEFNKRYILTND